MSFKNPHSVSNLIIRMDTRQDLFTNLALSLEELYILALMLSCSYIVIPRNSDHII
jgi:hypothetical protein